MPNTSFLCLCKPLPLNAAKKCKIKDDGSGVKTNPILGRSFQTLKRVRDFLTLFRKTARAAV